MSHPITFVLPVVACRRVDAGVSARGMASLIEVALALPDAFGLRLRLEAGGDAPIHAGLVISGYDPGHAELMALRIKTVAAVTVPFIRFGDPVPAPAPAVDGPEHYALVPGVGALRGTMHLNGMPIAAAAALPTRSTVEIRFDRLTGGFDGPDVECAVAVRGSASAASLVATLLAADSVGAVRLEARMGPASAIMLPLAMAGYIAAAPCRLVDAWPEAPPATSSELLSMFEDSVPPHAVVFGGSGLGKTTLLEHRIAAASKAGRVVAVLCPTGDLARRAAAILAGLNVAFDAVDFGSEEACPGFNICQPPTWVHPSSHIDDLVDAIEQSWLGTLTPEMFGPVGRRCLRAALSVAVLDPDGPHPLSALNELLGSQRLAQHWHEAISRIDDPAVTELMRQTRAAVENDREQSYSSWILSKIEPFLTHRMARIIDTTETSVSVEGLRAGRSFIVSAPAAALGDHGSTVTMGILLAQIWHLVRCRKHPGQPVDVILDEAQRIPERLLRTLLAEVRKYGVRLVLATQTTASFSPQTLTAVLANCGTVGAFRVSSADAATLDQRFPTVPAGQMQRLRRHWIAVSTGERDGLGPTPPPIVGSVGPEALTDAHLATLGVTSLDTTEPRPPEV